MELMVLGQGQGEQMMHRDTDSWPYVPREARRRLLFSANIALTDFTEHQRCNGGCAPGSHEWPDERDGSEPEETTQAIMCERIGAVCIRGDVLHGGGANTEV